MIEVVRHPVRLSSTKPQIGSTDDRCNSNSRLCVFVSLPWLFNQKTIFMKSGFNNLSPRTREPAQKLSALSQEKLTRIELFLKLIKDGDEQARILADKFSDTGKDEYFEQLNSYLDGILAAGEVQS